ncbi:hypothetical protein DTO271G3_1231 [Paecilomyces variotii]|nr:hypothetical protein DTO271G3_1231 [Paecilomyces variotii]
MWAKIDEEVMKRFPLVHGSLETPRGIMKLGLGAMELVSSSLLADISGNDSDSNHSTSCVVEFSIRDTYGGHRDNRSFRSVVHEALEELVPLIHFHYPLLFEKVYIIRPCEEYLTRLEIPECLLTKTTILHNRDDLKLHLGVEVPPENGAAQKLPASGDYVGRKGLEPESTGKDMCQSVGKRETATKDYVIENEEESPSGSDQKSSTQPQPEPMEPAPRLIYSETIGPPTIILDPEDLKTAKDLFPEKMGARVVFADSDMVAKFGHGVGLAEAEALHLVATRTTIPVPKLLSAYILDGT